MSSPNYPQPLIVPPLKAHKQTMILLHGRGSNGPQFGEDLLRTQLPSSPTSSSPFPETLRTAFPHAKFVFPTASKRRAVQFNRSVITQWFDLWWSPPSSKSNSEKTVFSHREELQIRGLRESTTFLHDLLRQEIALVEGGAKNVVLGGISQGCATSLVACLLWDGVSGVGEEGEALGALVGFCGRLPFGTWVRDIIIGDDGVKDDGGIEGEEFNPFSFGDIRMEEDGFQQDRDPVGKAIDFLREELEIPRSSNMASSPSEFLFQRTPIFFGHGTKDGTVPMCLGKEAANCLEAMGMDVSWNEYERLGHWYSEDMLRDCVNFIREKTDWE
ncbi:hypothetical protein AJ79_02416 [Helicocarpus griseus UAMH5409]|uniref:Phospholipase/carboxylesterase/thioesterase domain-containing protein n=1 Tax=Helicocarpus griseus UAMH5409 TaxID=1447875 RepID=A0A2B7Y2E5_9EURO|nr:hypothetical protein AJ79_02416 [Helicocarpus griseus UAMH5409]